MQPVCIPSARIALDGGVGRRSGELANHAVVPSATGRLLPYAGAVLPGQRQQQAKLLVYVVPAPDLHLGQFGMLPGMPLRIFVRSRPVFASPTPSPIAI